MQRKLIRQGAGGYTIYLPKRWVEQQHLEKGTTISMEPVPGGLLVRAQAGDPFLETKVKLTHESESSIRVIITNAYRLGYDKVSVVFADEAQFCILKEVVRSRLMGFEITSKDHDSCTIENIAEPSPERFETLMRKVLYGISEYLHGTQDLLQGKQVDLGELADSIERYDNFCRRAISRDRMRNTSSEMLWAFLASIMHGQRELYHLHQVSPTRSPGAVRLLEGITKVFDAVKEAYLKRDPTVVGDIHEMHAAAREEGQTLLAEKKEDALVIHLLLSANRQFYLASSPLLGYLLGSR